MNMGDNYIQAVRKMLFDFELEEQERLGNIVRKCSVTSIKLRQSGNELYISKKHDEKIHEKILSLYSESIAFAPVNSEELALAYSNRSALLLHLHYPDKSLVDIATALEVTKSTDLRTKLLSRKTNCLQVIEKSNDAVYNNSDNLKIPTFVPSQQIPCAAECVRIDCNKQFGRHMVATRDIEPGEVIVTEKGYAVFPSEQIYLNCSHCLCLAWNGVPCDFCAFTIYCSETCKKEAWNAYHDVECCIILYIFLKQKDKSKLGHMMITARIFITAVKREGIKNILCIAESVDKQDICTKHSWSNEEFNCTTFKCCYNLSHGKSIMGQSGYTEENYIEEDIILNLLYKYTSIFDTFKHSNSNKNVNDETRIFLSAKKILVKLRNIVNINNFGYEIIKDHKSDLDCNDRRNSWLKGYLLAPCSSLINHSCYPNVSKILMPKRKIVMITVLPVKKGEQLYYNYGTAVCDEKPVRQKYLQDNYDFTCECQACKINWSLESFNNMEVMPEVDDIFRLKQDFQLINSRLKGSMKDWPVDAEAIKEAIEVCKLISKNFKYSDALGYSVEYVNFITVAFCKLYQEKRSLPCHC